jgi:hypothetical protein
MTIADHTQQILALKSRVLSSGLNSELEAALVEEVKGRML